MNAYQPSLADLRQIVSGDYAAFRFNAELKPVGGDGEKIFPPTYSNEKRSDKYCKERRVVDGSESETVLLDSVQSQANRMEAALQALYDSDRLDIPMVQVSFPDELASIGRVTVLQAPHRLADAILRDSTVCEGGKDVKWRESSAGRRFINSNMTDARGVLSLAPTALLFGMWDSTGGAGSGGNKFARALVSEIVGFGVRVGVKPQSRLDPLQIEKSAGPLYEHPTDSWTLNSAEAVQEKGEPKKLKTGDGSEGGPSAVNHGNILPSIDSEAGGVSVEYAKQSSVLSLTRLRMIRFGTVPDVAQRDARAYLAALGLVSLAAQQSSGYWLRSRCELVPIPEKPLTLELVKADGTVEQLGRLSLDDALGLVSAAAQSLRTHGMLPPDGQDVVDLKPMPKLVTLVQRSRGMNPEGA
jgi:CRISPR-associated protein Csb1